MTNTTKQTEAISTERALKLALEALEAEGDAWIVLERKAKAALREALTSVPDWASEAKEQPAQQKLVPYEPSIDMQEQGSIASGYDLSQARAKKVYQAMIDMHDVMMEREPTDEWFRLQAGYPEQPAQPQEPVAWIRTSDLESLPLVPPTVDDGYTAPGQQLKKTILSAKPHDYYGQIPLYTSPPANKPWVGLTDDERDSIANEYQSSAAAALMTEAKLRERNT